MNSARSSSQTQTSGLCSCCGVDQNLSGLTAILERLRKCNISNYLQMMADREREKTMAEMKSSRWQVIMLMAHLCTQARNLAPASTRMGWSAYVVFVCHILHRLQGRFSCRPLNTPGTALVWYGCICVVVTHPPPQAFESSGAYLCLGTIRKEFD